MDSLKKKFRRRKGNLLPLIAFLAVMFTSTLWFVSVASDDIGTTPINAGDQNNTDLEFQENTTCEISGWDAIADTAQCGVDKGQRILQLTNFGSDNRFISNVLLTTLSILGVALLIFIIRGITG